MINEIAVVFVSGLSIGVLGSFHCIGMCGPLALALPVNHKSVFQKYASILLYNLGRTFSYASMGVIFGLLGESFTLFKLQQALSIFAGIAILVILFFNKFGFSSFLVLGKYTQKIKVSLGNYLRSERPVLSYFSIGIVNGFLPCGLVYLAIASAIATGSVLNSSLLMFSFGIGTIPIMAITMIFGKFISLNIRKKLNAITPYFIASVAVLLILRGMNLGIPYISPTHNVGHVNCCHVK